MATTSEMLNYVNKWGYKDLMKETKLPKDRLTIILKRSNSMESKDMKRDRKKVEEAFDRIIEAARLKEQKLEEQVQTQQQNNQVYQVSSIPQQNQNNQKPQYNQTPQKQAYQNKTQTQQRTQNIQKQEQKPEVTTSVISSPKCDQVSEDQVSEEVKTASNHSEIPEKDKGVEFSIKLKRIMNEKKISAVSLINKSGLSQATISRYLTGAACPKRNAAKIALAKALNVPVSELFDGENIDEPVVMAEIARESVVELPTTSSVRVKRLYPEVQKLLLTFSDGSLLIVRGSTGGIDIDFESASDKKRSFKRKEDLHNFISDSNYTKILKVKVLQNLFAELGIPEKDFMKEIAVIADL